MRNILVTGAGGSAASNFVDSLTLAGEGVYSIYGADVKPYHLELDPVRERFLLPRATDPEYINVLNRIIDRAHIDFVHSQPDHEVAFLSKNRQKVNAKMFLPSKAAIELCHDKMKFNRAMVSAGVPVPATFHIKDKASLASALKTLLSKNDRVWLRAVRGAGSRASLPVFNLLQAEGWIDYWGHFKQLKYTDFMVSELLPGKEFAWQSLWHNGQLITCQARERVEYIYGNLMPSGQTSSPSVARTVHREDVNHTGEASVRAADAKPHGIYCVDMKENSNGVPMVTEINIGRFFTTSNFFAHAGLNMPDMYIRLGLGESIPPVKRYNPLPENLYWVRMVDMGYKLVKDGNWTSHQV